MLKSYIVIALRNFWRNKGFLLISITGLALGIVAFLFIVAFANFEFSYDKFHHNNDRLYRVSVDVYKNGTFENSDAECYNLAGPMMKQDLPEVEAYVNARGMYTYSVSYREKLFKETRILFAEPAFLELFNYPAVQGNVKEALTSPYSAVLTESAAKKLFEDEDPLGKEIILNGKNAVTVKAVIADIPANVHMHFDYLLSYATAQALFPKSNWFPNWEGNNGFTYVLLRKDADIAALREKMKAFSKKYLVNREEVLTLQLVKDIHLYSHKTFEAEANRDGRSVKLLLGIGFLILVIAWINYINLATSRSVERAREVGIRKTLGSQTSQIVRQFMLESAIINMVAVCVAVLMADLLYPVVISITGAGALSWELGTNLWAYGLLFFVAGTLLSGFYPAWVLSAYKPASILKGKFSTSVRGIMLRKVLVVAQFVASFGLIAGTITIYLQVQYMQQRDLGLKMDQVLVLPAPTNIPDSLRQQRIATFSNKVQSLPYVEAIGMAETIPGNGTSDLNSTSGSIYRTKSTAVRSPIYYLYDINETYLKSLDIPLVAGNNFSDQPEQNKDRVIINEEALSKLGFANPEEAVGAKLYWGNDYRPEIIGVIRNYHHLSLNDNLIPLIFFYDQFRGSYFTVHLGGGAPGHADAIAELHELWKESFGDNIFEHFYLDQRFNAQYADEKQFSGIFTAFTLLAVFIACLGLLGLSAYSVVQRTKEIGIRKVLGASIVEIIRTLSVDFMKLILLAIFIAVLGSFWIINAWLNSYAFRIQLNWWIMVIPAVLLLMIAMLTIGYHTVKAASANPVDSLKSE